MRDRQALYAAFVVLLCSKTVSADDFTDLYPSKSGTKWTYRISNQEERMIFVAGEGEKVGDRRCVKLEASVGGKVVGVQHDLVSKEGLYRHKINHITVDPPVCFLKASAKKGESWTQDIKNSFLDIRFKFTLDSEDIEVPAGKFKNCVVTRGEVTEKGKQSQSTYWYAKGVGMVKQRAKRSSGEEFTIELEKIEIPAK